MTWVSLQEEVKISLPQFLGAVIGYQLKPLRFTLLHVSLKRLVLGLWSLVPIGAMASNLLTAVKSKITHLVEQTYCGSGDIEAQDTVTFHDYFKQTYPPGSTSRDELVQKFKNLEWRVAQLTGWIPPTSNAVVLPWPQDGKVQRLLVEPSQLGLLPDDSVKGPSKMVYILDTVQSFLDRPFLSEKEPLDILFAKDQSPGEQVRPWSLVHSIGMGRSSAARIILECVVPSRCRAGCCRGHCHCSLAHACNIRPSNNSRGPAPKDTQDQDSDGRAFSTRSPDDGQSLVNGPRC